MLKCRYYVNITKYKFKEYALFANFFVSVADYVAQAMSKYS